MPLSWALGFGSPESRWPVAKRSGKGWINWVEPVLIKRVVDQLALPIGTGDGNLQ